MAAWTRAIPKQTLWLPNVLLSVKTLICFNKIYVYEKQRPADMENSEKQRRRFFKTNLNSRLSKPPVKRRKAVCPKR